MGKFIILTFLVCRAKNILFKGNLNKNNFYPIKFNVFFIHSLKEILDTAG